MKIPKVVQTELGEATVGVVKPEAATKEYLCPLCDEQIEKGEKHLLVVPVVITRLRRHVHTECLIAFEEGGWSVKLHPNEPEAVKYYL